MSLKPLIKPARLLLPWYHPAVLVASVGGFGHLPNTKLGHCGSMGMSLLTPFLLWPILGNTGAVLLVVLLANWLGAWAVMKAEHYSGGIDHDARAVVVDELAGAALAVWVSWQLFEGLLPGFLGTLTTLQMAEMLLFVGLCFRAFDLLKPPPAKWCDSRWHHPYSIMADDLIAGVYAGFFAVLPFWILGS